MSKYEGGCHCGNIRYLYCTDVLAADWSVRRCMCTYCQRLGARYTAAKDASLVITIQNKSMSEDYEFGTRTARFLWCGRCGVMIGAMSGRANELIAVLNVNTMDDLHTLAFDAKPTDFDNEELDQRLARRQANWIQTVTLNYVNA